VPRHNDGSKIFNQLTRSESGYPLTGSEPACACGISECIPVRVIMDWMNRNLLLRSALASTELSQVALVLCKTVSSLLNATVNMSLRFSNEEYAYMHYVIFCNDNVNVSVEYLMISTYINIY
jgi:hypothetical protein